MFTGADPLLLRTDVAWTAGHHDAQPLCEGDQVRLIGDGASSRTQQSAEVRRPKAELRRVTAERDVLKKPRRTSQGQSEVRVHTQALSKVLAGSSVLAGRHLAAGFNPRVIARCQLLGLFVVLLLLLCNFALALFKGIVCLCQWMFPGSDGVVPNAWRAVFAIIAVQ